MIYKYSQIFVRHRIKYVLPVPFGRAIFMAWNTPLLSHFCHHVLLSQGLYYIRKQRNGEGGEKQRLNEVFIGVSLMHLCKWINKIFTNWWLMSTFGSEKTLYKVICCTALSNSRKSTFLRSVSRSSFPSIPVE